VLARRCHRTGASPITLRWIIDDHPGWPSAAALRTLFRYHWAKANRILTDSSSRQHNSGSEEVADRDPETIKRDIDQARDQFASTVDSLAERANPRGVADDVKAGVVRFVRSPGGRLAGRRWRPDACASRPPHPATLTGSGQRRRAERNQSENEKLGGLATRPRRLQLYTMMGRCAVTSSAELAPDAPVVRDASMVDTANTSFRTAHRRRRPCDSL
jgi:hypothetical protein